MNLPYQRHSRTSKAAADSVTGAQTQRQAVLAYLKDNGFSTDEQMQKALGMNPSTQRPRRVELVRLGLVMNTGLTGTTSSGRSAVLWGYVHPLEKPTGEWKILEN